MQALPRDPAPPKLSPREVSLAPLAELAVSQVGSDELVTDVLVERMELAAHSCEFVELCSVRVGGGTLADSDWYRTNWVDVDLDGVDAANACLTESGLKRVAWQNCRMVGLATSGCTLTDVSHTGCGLQMLNLRFANLTRVSFTGCDLSGADFTSARLQEVSFTDCQLTGAVFSQAQCRRVMVRGGSLAGIVGLDGLRGATLHVDSLVEIAQEMAQALGIGLVEA